jgi:hypothetical protein
MGHSQQYFKIIFFKLTKKKMRHLKKLENWNSQWKPPFCFSRKKSHKYTGGSVLPAHSLPPRRYCCSFLSKSSDQLIKQFYCLPEIDWNPISYDNFILINSEYTGEELFLFWSISQCSLTMRSDDTFETK